MLLTYAIILLYFIIFNNLYCDQTPNIVLDHVIVVHFCDNFTS